jgi:Uma2 family endonuclease
MQAATLITIDEYLHTPYDPDCDYVDGVIEERNLGETSHATLQALITVHLMQQRRAAGIHVMTEARIQTQPTRFRIPDIVVTNGKPTERVLSTPPLLCIEILSPEDRLSRIQARADEYLAMGVPEVWIVDPESLRTYVCDSSGLHEVRDRLLVTKDGRVRLDLDAIEQDLRD